MKRIMQSSAASHHFLPLRSKYFPQHPALSILSICSFLSGRDQDSRSYRITGKNYVTTGRVIAWLLDRRTSWYMILLEQVIIQLIKKLSNMDQKVSLYSLHSNIYGNVSWLSAI